MEPADRQTNLDDKEKNHKMGDMEQQGAESLTGNSFPFLIDLCVDLIMSFLDSRSLWSLAICHQRFGPIVSYDHVLSAARATESRNVHSIIKGIKEQAVDNLDIFMPSPMRLLRLTNGVHCELCRKCTVSTVTCGLFFCHGCVETLLIQGMDNPPRVQLSSPFADASGEYSGPHKNSIETFDAKQRERHFRYLHESQTGWTAGRQRAFCQIYEAKIGSWTWEDDDSSYSSVLLSTYWTTDSSVSVSSPSYSSMSSGLPSLASLHTSSTPPPRVGVLYRTGAGSHFVRARSQPLVAASVMSNSSGSVSSVSWRSLVSTPSVGVLNRRRTGTQFTRTRSTLLDSSASLDSSVQHTPTPSVGVLHRTSAGNQFSPAASLQSSSLSCAVVNGTLDIDFLQQQEGAASRPMGSAAVGLRQRGPARLAPVSAKRPMIVSIDPLQDSEHSLSSLEDDF